MTAPISHHQLVWGQNIARIRKARGMSQRNLGAAINMTDSAISRIEKGQRGIDAEQAELIAGALKVHPAVLLFSRAPDNAADRIVVLETALRKAITEIAVRAAVDPESPPAWFAAHYSSLYEALN